MTRVGIVLGASLAFAILGLVAGHFCVSVYSGGYALNAAGQSVRVASTEHVRPEFVIGCYLAAPLVAAFVGFVASIIALALFGPRHDS